jgi:putative transposase
VTMNKGSSRLSVGDNWSSFDQGLGNMHVSTFKLKVFLVAQSVGATLKNALKQVELGMPVADLTRRLGISEVTYYRWKKQYAGMQSDQVRELKQLQDENGRLKKLVANLSLDKAILQDINSKKWPGPR